MKDQQIPQYLKEIMDEFMGKDAEVVPGVYMINVYHDNWCDQLNGRGICNCNPDVVTPKKRN